MSSLVLQPAAALAHLPTATEQAATQAALRLYEQARAQGLRVTTAHLVAALYGWGAMAGVLLVSEEDADATQETLRREMRYQGVRTISDLALPVREAATRYTLLAIDATAPVGDDGARPTLARAFRTTEPFLDARRASAHLLVQGARCLEEARLTLALAGDARAQLVFGGVTPQSLDTAIREHGFGTSA